MEMDYVNDLPRNRRKTSGDSQQTVRRLHQVLFLSFGLLCVTQAVLNVSLRLTLYYGKEWTNSDCNITHASDYNQTKGQTGGEHCNKLQDSFNALTREKNLLQNQVSVLNNELKKLQRELKDMCSSTDCPIDWREIGGRCYFLSSEMKTWVESRNFCQREGADLVVINNTEEQRALYRLDEDNELLFWIGLDGRDGTFKWVDGSPLTEEFWQDGQPDDGGPNTKVEDCVEMYHHNPVYANWNDAPCESKRRWLCEKN